MTDAERFEFLVEEYAREIRSGQGVHPVQAAWFLRCYWEEAWKRCGLLPKHRNPTRRPPTRTRRVKALSE